MKLKKSIFIFSVALLTCVSCNNSDSESSNSFIRQKTPEELKNELKQQEQSNPADYLYTEGTYEQNFWGDKFKIDFIIYNKATLTSFKDAIVRVKYFTKTKTVLGSKDFTIYEEFSPLSSKTIQLKVDNYSDVNSIDWEIISATAVN